MSVAPLTAGFRPRLLMLNPSGSASQLRRDRSTLGVRIVPPPGILRSYASEFCILFVRSVLNLGPWNLEVAPSLFLLSPHGGPAAGTLVVLKKEVANCPPTQLSIVNRLNINILIAMKEFALIFRLKDIGDFKPSAQQMQERMNWLAGIAAQNKLADKGNTLLPTPGSAKTVRPDNVVTDGPYTEIKEFISGYVVIRAEDIDEAVQIAKANPIFHQVGGNIEVREVLKRD